MAALEVAFWRGHCRGPQLAGALCHFLVAGAGMAKGSTGCSFHQYSCFSCSSSYLGVRFSQLECHFTDLKKILKKK